MSHFNEKAKEWDSESKIKMMTELAKKTLPYLNLKSPVDIMDFGCGTGLFGLEFADYAKTLTGVDTSEGMLEVFDKKTQGHDEIKSVLVDLEKETLNQKFDLIVSSMAFHHLESPLKMILKLKAMLNPGGQIAIVDLDQEDGSFHPDNKSMGVKHHGFSQKELVQWAQIAEMDLQYQIINDIKKNDQNYSQFLAILSKS